MTRMPPVSRSDLEGEDQATYDTLLKGFNARPGYPQKKEVGGLYAQLLHSPEMAARVSAVGDCILTEGGIDLLDKEITCLSVARELNCQLEWTVHEPMSRKAGVREEVIDGIKHRNLDGFTRRERLFVDYSWEVLRDDVADETWDAMEEIMGKRG